MAFPEIRQSISEPRNIITTRSGGALYIYTPQRGVSAHVQAFSAPTRPNGHGPQVARHGRAGGAWAGGLSGISATCLPETPNQSIQQPCTAHFHHADRTFKALTKIWPIFNVDLAEMSQ